MQREHLGISTSVVSRAKAVDQTRGAHIFAHCQAESDATDAGCANIPDQTDYFTTYGMNN
ncbi:MAG: hypothetical protein HC802_05240 [Caldilineaceae bacterium]|nr:hypothetical protein [Caldilineaceae bacterium]